MTQGYLIGATGVPGSGKSHFARSASAVGHTVAALIDPKEAHFYGDLVAAAQAAVALTDGAKKLTEVIADLDWRPHKSEYKAGGFLRLLAWVAERETDASQFVVIDPMSEVSDLAMHEALKMHSTNDPSDVPYGRAYTAHDNQLKSLLTELRRLCRAGKTVICTFHGRMREQEGAGDPKRGKSMEGKEEWQFEEQMLPVINTSLRQSIHSPFDLWLYTKPIGFGAGRKFYVTAQPDAVRPAKHSVQFKAGADIARIPNDVASLLALIAH